MAQTTDALNSVNGKLEYSIDGGAAVDVSGFLHKLKASPVKRKAGKKYTADGDSPIVKGGKLDAHDVAVDFIYTEGATDPFKALFDAMKAKSTISWVWSSAGGAATEFEFTAAAGEFTECDLPPIETENADPVVFSVKSLNPSVTQASISA